MSNGTSEDNLVGVFHGETIIGVVKDNFNKGVDGSRAGSFVKEGLAFFLRLFEGVSFRESNEVSTYDALLASPKRAPMILFQC
jgi:hypothetical protein